MMKRMERIYLSSHYPGEGLNYECLHVIVALSLINFSTKQMKIDHNFICTCFKNQNLLGSNSRKTASTIMNLSCNIFHEFSNNNSTVQPYNYCVTGTMKIGIFVDIL